jgi:hypothetical protein
MIHQLRAIDRRVRLGTIVAVVAFGAGLLFCLAPVPLGPKYHDFADKRTIFGIRNAGDVLSNIPFMVVGVWGLSWILQRKSSVRFSQQLERVPYGLFFLGVSLTGFGSLYYHLAPGNSRLIWDLLPMTVSFLSMISAVTMERISARAGLVLLSPLLGLGITSVGYWYLTEAAHHGDLRFYLFVEFFSPIVIAAIVGLFPVNQPNSQDLFIAFLLFVAAKLLELLDRETYSALRMISGHSLKHIIAAVSCVYILRMLKRRRRAPAESRTIAG